MNNIIKNISLIRPEFKFEEGNTLLFFDEIQLNSVGYKEDYDKTWR